MITTTNPNFIRRSSIYVMTVNIDDPDLIKERIDWMIDTTGVDCVGSMPGTDGIVFAFRATDDTAADTAATYLAVDRPFKLFTGIGVHRREVVVA